MQECGGEPIDYCPECEGSFAANRLLTASEKHLAVHRAHIGKCSVWLAMFDNTVAFLGAECRLTGFADLFGALALCIRVHTCMQLHVPCAHSVGQSVGSLKSYNMYINCKVKNVQFFGIIYSDRLCIAARRFLPRLLSAPALQRAPG